MTQPSLLDGVPVCIPVTHAVDPVARPRLIRQARAILARLEQGPATNRELNDLAFSYRLRLSEIRQAGYDVQCEEHAATGVSVYRLR